MSDNLDAYPVGIIEDRYCGTYSGGNWIAVAEFWTFRDVPEGYKTRLEYVYGESHADDTSAMVFGGVIESTPWIGVGKTSEEALKNLYSKLKDAP